jgi:DNA-binding NarL/FixJ family response regulator
MTSVLIADDQALVRGGFRMILDAQPDLEVVGEADDGRDAVEQTRLRKPDVVLMDVRMPGMDGIEATRQILSGHTEMATRVLMLTTFDLDEYVYEALKAGAAGFLLKNTAPPELVEAIRSVARGDALLAPSITRRLIEEYVRRPRAGHDQHPELQDLTAREREVLMLIARGQSNAEIAETLVVSEATVRTHVNRVLTKLDLRDRTQAAVLAYETGLVTAGR